jgi:hypothetical protein
MAIQSTEQYLIENPESITKVSFLSGRHKLCLMRVKWICDHFKDGKPLTPLNRGEFNTDDSQINIEHVRVIDGQIKFHTYTLTTLHDASGIDPKYLKHSKILFSNYNKILALVEDFTQLTIGEYTHGEFYFL